MVTIPGAGTYKLASMGKRFLARLLDGLIVGVPLGVRVVTAQTAAVPGRGTGGGPAFARWAVLNLPGVVPGIGGLWVLICVLSPFFDNIERRGFHDKAAKTWVLSTK